MSEPEQSAHSAGYVVHVNNGHVTTFIDVIPHNIADDGASAHAPQTILSDDDSGLELPPPSPKFKSAKELQLEDEARAAKRAADDKAVVVIHSTDAERAAADAALEVRMAEHITEQTLLHESNELAIELDDKCVERLQAISEDGT